MKPSLRSEFERAERFVKRAKAAEAEVRVLTARIARAEALLQAWEHDAPGLVDRTFAGRLRETLRRDPSPVRLRGDA